MLKDFGQMQALLVFLRKYEVEEEYKPFEFRGLESEEAF